MVGAMAMGVAAIVAVVLAVAMAMAVVWMIILMSLILRSMPAVMAIDMIMAAAGAMNSIFFSDFEIFGSGCGLDGWEGGYGGGDCSSCYSGGGCGEGRGNARDNDGGRNYHGYGGGCVGSSGYDSGNWGSG